MSALRLRRATTAAPVREEIAPLRIELAGHGSVEVRCHRDRRARRLRLLVDAGGARMTLPAQVSPRAAEQFLLQQRDWLRQQLQRRPAASSMDAAPVAEGRLPLRGSLWTLRRLPARRLTLRRVDDGIELLAPAELPPLRLAAALREFYTAEARADVGHWLPALLPGLPVPPSRFKFAPLRSLWGSLNRDGVVSLDLALILAPPAVFHYVLVHELCHLIHRHHQPPFWREVAARCPHWQFQRDWLRRHGDGIKGQLQALLQTAR